MDLYMFSTTKKKKNLIHLKQNKTKLKTLNGYFVSVGLILVISLISASWWSCSCVQSAFHLPDKWLEVMSLWRRGWFLPYSLGVSSLWLIGHAALGLVKQPIIVGVCIGETVQPWQEKRQEEEDDSKELQGHVPSDPVSTHKASLLEGSITF